MSEPKHHGLPPKFSAWRRGQERALKRILYSRDRFDILNIPVGGGKSATYMAAAMTDEEERAAIIVPTRHLMDQLMDDFERIGLVEMRGRQNYVCTIKPTQMADRGRCTAGLFCEFIRKVGCPYYDQKFEASNARMVVTNYSYWLATEESNALGLFNTLIFDEAHLAADEIARFAQVEIARADLERFGVPLPDKFGRSITKRVHEWAPNAIDVIEKRLEPGGRVGADVSLRKRGKDMLRDLRRLCRLSEQDWLFSRVAEKAWRWDLIEPGALAEDLLFRGAKKIVLSSATVNKKTPAVLGIDVGDGINVIEQESTFPVANRPIYWWPVARVDWGMSDLARKYWVRAMVDIVNGRTDRKGIVHTVSYERAWEIFYALRELCPRTYFIVHKQSEKLTDALDRFDRAREGAVFLSPAVEQGVDFPYRRAEYQIIPKCPFPDARDPLLKARKKRDADYIPYVTSQRIVQMSGRVVRAVDDRAETFILDGHFEWLRGGYWDFYPRYFHAAVRTLARRDDCPVAPRRLAA